MKETIAFVGLDVHKKSISVAVADGGVRKEARYFGKIANSAQALSKLAAKLSHKGRTLRFCYEAGPCCYGIHRQQPIAHELHDASLAFRDLRLHQLLTEGLEGAQGRR